MSLACNECEVKRSNGLSMAVHQKIKHNIDTGMFDRLELMGDVHELQKELNRIRNEIKLKPRYEYVVE